MFATRRIEGSFAVVEVADYPGIQVLHDNRPVARTDDNGRALVTGLRGYDVNRISIEPSDLPYDAEVSGLQLEVIPPARSGVLQRIPIKRSRAASFRVVDAKGEPLPPGTQLRIFGQAQDFPVGFDGRSFVAGLTRRNRIDANGPQGKCTLQLELKVDGDELPELGTLSCL